MSRLTFILIFFLCFVLFLGFDFTIKKKVIVKKEIEEIELISI